MANAVVAAARAISIDLGAVEGAIQGAGAAGGNLRG